jgi:uncharacterized protein YuzE
MKIKIGIRNCSNETISINKEPEALEAFIEAKDEIEVETNEAEDNILINIGKKEDGTIYVQIWDAQNTQYIIHHKGKDMFEEYFK